MKRRGCCVMADQDKLYGVSAQAIAFIQSAEKLKPSDEAIQWASEEYSPQPNIHSMPACWILPGMNDKIKVIKLGNF